MLAPDSVLNEHYRITYLVDDRPDCKLYRAIDQRQSLRVLIAELPQPSEAALGDVRALASQIVGVSAPGLLALRDHFAQELSYFLVADDAGGQDLERVARDRGGPLPEDEVLTNVDRLLVALDALHSHVPPLYLGDLQSSDLWSSPDGGLFLAPFALARHIGAAESPYRAPELNDATAEPTSASDLYAIGAVLYQLLTGWAPPTAQQREAGTPLNSPRVLNARVSALAEQLVLRGLELKPANRYQRAPEMRSALETVRLMAGRPLGATAPIITEQLRTVGPPAPASSPAAVAPGGTGVPAPPRPVPGVPAPGESGGFGPPPAALPPVSLPQPGYPPAQPQYASYGGPAVAAAPPRRGLSTGCLVGIVAALGVVALALCIALAIGFWYVSNAGSVPSFMPGSAATVPTSGAAAASTTAPAPSGPATIEGAATFTQTRQISEDAVGTVIYAPDGATIAVGLGGTIELRRGEQFEPAATLSGHSGDIIALAFSPDSATLASGAQDDTVIRLWDAANGREIRQISGHTGWIRSLAYSPDGAILASASIDRTIRLWDARSGVELAVLEGHTDWLGNIAFSPDGATIASASRDGTVRLWDVQNRQPRGEPLYTAPANPDTQNRPFWLTGLAYSPDGARLAAGSINGSVYVIDANSGRLLRELKGHESLVTIRGVSFSPDGRTLASASFDGGVRLWLPGSGVELGELRQGGLRLFGLSFSPDSSRLAVSSDSAGRVQIWDVEARQVVQTLQIAQGVVTAISYGGGDEVIATGGAGGMVRLLSTTDGSTIRSLNGGAATTQYVEFLGDTRLLAVSGAGEVMLIDLAAGGETKQLQGLNGLALNLAVTHDQRLIAAGNERGEVTIWDGGSLERQRTLSGLSGPVYTLAFNSDGSRLAAVTNASAERPQIMVWDVQSGQRQATISGHSDLVTGIQMPAGENVVVSTSSDGSLKVWDAASGAEQRSIAVEAADGFFSSVAYSPDGSLLVTGTLSGAVTFWNPRSGEPISRLELGGGSVLALSFRADGGQLAVSTRDGGIFLLEPSA